MILIIKNTPSSDKYKENLTIPIKDIKVVMNETIYQLIKNYPNWYLGRKEVDTQFKRYE